MTGNPDSTLLDLGDLAALLVQTHHLPGSFVIASGFTLMEQAATTLFEGGRRDYHGHEASGGSWSLMLICANAPSWLGELARRLVSDFPGRGARRVAAI